MTRNRNTRRKGEIELERNSLTEKTHAEIEALVAQHHARVPRESAAAVGGIYARYSTRFQDSIADQVRSLLEEAERRGIFVPRGQVFFDTATRGYRDRRPGLNALRAALAEGKLAVLLVFATNRLYRKAYKSLQFVEEEVVERGGRCIFVKSGIDTAEGDGWRTWMQIHAMMDEMGVGMYADHVRAGQQGLFERGMVYGALPAGYAGEDVPGEFTKRQKPRQKIVIESSEARFVESVFRCFVTDCVPISEIARRLNDDPEAPWPSRSQTGRWTHRTVRNLLMNACYRGFWSYGKTVTKWQSKKDYARQLLRDEPLRTKQFDHLRIVSDEVWYAAQAKLATYQRPSGRKPKDGDQTARPRLLNGFFWCPIHARALEVSGRHGHAMICKDCRGTDAATRPLFTYLDRQLALQVLCAKIADLLRADEELVHRIVVACQQQAQQLQQADPTRLQQLNAQDAKIARSIEFAVKNLGDTDDDLQLAQNLVHQLRQQRAALLAEVKQLEAAQKRQIRVPSATEVVRFLGELQQILETAALSPPDQEAGRVREVFRLMTGGRISLCQQGERRKHGGWLQGRFHCDVLGYSVGQLTGAGPAGQLAGEEVVVDFLPPVVEHPHLDRVWELHEGGYLNKQIAQELCCSRSLVTKLLQQAAKKYGVTLEDGRARRGRLRCDQEGPPLFQRIADEVKRFADEGVHFHVIAEQLDCSLTLITKAWKFWHTSRGLEVPDGRTRRKSLAHKQVA
ncbi:MAG: recombinase family protein [Pirellulaceae bacterium]